MPFRKDEAAESLRMTARNYLVGRTIDPDMRLESLEKFDKIVADYGPVIESYPTWHPIVRNQDPRYPCTRPEETCGYLGLDHTVLLANGFITCPYHDGSTILDSVQNLKPNEDAEIAAEILDVQFYAPNATPVFVKCEWKSDYGYGLTIPGSVAIGIFLEMEVPNWRWATRAETWDAMRPLFLGSPHGAKSSLLVSPETGQQMKNIWNNLNKSGIFGATK